jgi:hypothetical protein
MSTEISGGEAPTGMAPHLRPVAALAWLWVLLPFSWGVYKLLEKVNDLF